MIICTTYRRARMLAEVFVLAEHKDCAVLDLGRRKYGVAAKEILTPEQLVSCSAIVTVDSLSKYIGPRSQANAGAGPLHNPLACAADE